MRKTLKISPVSPIQQLPSACGLEPGLAWIPLTLDRVIERKNVNTLAVFDVVAGVDSGDIAKLDTQVVTSDYVRVRTIESVI